MTGIRPKQGPELSKSSFAFAVIINSYRAPGKFDWECTHKHFLPVLARFAPQEGAPTSTIRQPGPGFDVFASGPGDTWATGAMRAIGCRCSAH